MDAKYGRQFSVTSCEETMPATAYGIEKYLGSGLVRGIGPKYARRIVRQFGEDTLDVIEETPERLLEVNGIGYFPDAPTERGVKHLRELAAAIKNGYKAMLAFVIQMDGVSEVRANVDTHPEFGVALEEAKKAGVEVLFLKCHVEPDMLMIEE